MDKLPDDVLITIFEYLDNHSKWSAMNVSIFWVNIFNISTKLLNNFELILNKENMEELLQVTMLPDVPIKNVVIENFNINNITCKEFKVVFNTLQTYQNSIQYLKLINVKFESTKYFTKIINDLKNIHEIELKNIEVKGKIQTLPEFRSLKSVTFHESNDKFFELFKNQKSIEKVSVAQMTWRRGFRASTFNEMAETLPNLNHIVMNGCGTGPYFDNQTFPYKIKKLEAFYLTFYWANCDARIDFLVSQIGHLKELTLEELPFDYDGDEVLKYIIEDMNLEKFYYGKIALILNGQKQQVDEFEGKVIQMKSIFEMFRQFPSIKKFRFYLTQTGFYEGDTRDIVNPRTSIFTHAQELEVLDHSDIHSLLSTFTNLYKNFRNISRLRLITNDKKINTVLEECLPEMTQLNEIYLNTNAPSVMERFEAIRNFSPGIKKLIIKSMFLNEAKEFFGNDLEILGI